MEEALNQMGDQALNLEQKNKFIQEEVQPKVVIDDKGKIFLLICDPNRTMQ